jgi:NAD(P)-dependent dehydrogenase (short-subunit alcohol dehydrogenase family)
MNTDPLERFRLDGRLALVTGASSGLGTHFARLLARCGARVAVAARRTDKLQALVEQIGAAGGHARAVALDVADAASVRRAFDTIADWGCVDVLVNNAGITVTKPLLQQTEQDWDSVIDTNLKGCWLVATEAARRMIAAGCGGCIVNVASILGERVAGGVAPGDEGDGTRAGAARHPRQCAAAGLRRHRPQPGFPRRRGREEAEGACTQPQLL